MGPLARKQTSMELNWNFQQGGGIQTQKPSVGRASDRVRKKITNYAEIFRNIMRKKVLIMRKTRWIMRKIFGSLRSPKLTSFHAAEIELLPKPRVCSQDNFKQKQLYWYLGFSSYFHLYLVCYEII